MEQQRRKASRETFERLFPMPESKTSLSLNRKFTEAEYELLSYGIIPIYMEEKWAIFLEDNCLYFHRSWTGFCIYKLKLEKEAGGYFAAETWVNREPSEYKETNDDYDIALLSFMIDNFLLGKITAFPA